MFNWMVHNLTGLVPSEYYQCIRNNLNMFNPHYDRATNKKGDNGKRLEIINKTTGQKYDFSEPNFAASQVACEAQRGMVVFAGDDEDSHFSELMKNWKNGTGMSYYVECCFSLSLELNLFICFILFSINNSRIRYYIWSVHDSVLLLHTRIIRYKSLQRSM